MSEIEDDLFGPLLAEIAASPSVGVATDHVRITQRLLTFASERSIPLSKCAESRFMDRKIDTLKRYVRQFDLQFVDYVPLKLRPKKEKLKREKKKDRAGHQVGTEGQQAAVESGPAGEH